MMRRIIVGMSFCLFLMLVGIANGIEPANSTLGVTVERAWVRAMPPSTRNTAAYFALKNNGNANIVITGASSDSAKEAQIHHSRDIDGYMSMERLESVALGPGETVEFTPGGIHLMLLGLEQVPAVGGTVNLCLLLTSGPAICVDAPVRKSAAKNSHDHH
ncbi:MAG: copper chaperone PCu(A)C [Halioglobus sp.]